MALLSGLGIWRCRELWCRSQRQLGSCFAALPAVVLIRPLEWELPHATDAALTKKRKRKKKKKKERKEGRKEGRKEKERKKGRKGKEGQRREREEKRKRK